MKSVVLNGAGQGIGLVEFDEKVAGSNVDEVFGVDTERSKKYARVALPCLDIDGQKVFGWLPRSTSRTNRSGVEA